MNRDTGVELCSLQGELGAQAQQPLLPQLGPAPGTDFH